MHNLHIIHLLTPPLPRYKLIHIRSDLSTRKVRRRVAPMAQELLFGDLANGNNGMDEMSRSYTIQDSSSSTRSSLIPLARVPSAPGSLKDHK